MPVVPTGRFGLPASTTQTITAAASRAASAGVAAAAPPTGHQRLHAFGDEVAGPHLPAEAEQAGGHAASHVADPDDPDVLVHVPASAAMS